LSSCLRIVAAAEGYSTRFAGQIKSLDCEGYVPRKWEKRIDVVMK
jgi:3-oxoacyl-[acyl-carrier-protein] synthase II